MLRYAVPPGYRRQQSPKRPKLGPWLGVIFSFFPVPKVTRRGQ
jgi:hypothetical protein